MATQLMLNVTQICQTITPTAWPGQHHRDQEASAHDSNQHITPVSAHIGSQFHAFARHLSQTLRQGSHEFASLTREQLFTILYHDQLKVYGEQLLQEQKIDELAQIVQSVHRLTDRFMQLRQQSPHAKTWRDILIAEEFSLTHIELTLAPKRLLMSGIIDSLRYHPSGDLEIVDYKLANDQYSEQGACQLACYAQLLTLTGEQRPIRGALEYFWPSLRIITFSPEQLQLIYQQQVEPALREAINRHQNDGQIPNQKLPCASTSTQPPTAPAMTIGAVIPDQQAPILAPVPEPTCSISVGVTRSIDKKTVSLPLAHLKRHVAIIGSSGSGKTTLAMRLVEQVLLAQIPLVIVDRKGDLCRYADPAAWSNHDSYACQRRELYDRLDVALFTPGHPNGRHLGIRILPSDLATMTETEQEQTYRTAAAALSFMMQFRDSDADRAKTAILVQAMALLDRQGTTPVTLDSLSNFIGDKDPALIDAIGYLNPKSCDRLVENLQTLAIMKGSLFADDHEEPLSAERLFGLDAREPASSRTRLSILSTKFLGDERTSLFWVAQLLSELARFTSRYPSEQLQALVLFDEADLYLPANAKPITKQPLENLLKRARSAGLGILLATQSPGDLDYRCRDSIRNWFMGLVKEKTALAKLKLAASESKLDIAAVLPKQKVGQFMMLTETETHLIMSACSLITPEQLSEQQILDLARRLNQGC
jgi:RecB family exonuclease/GTPase SAR1 family protein